MTVITTISTSITDNHSFTDVFLQQRGHAVAQYKPEGRGFDSRMVSM
jgi:hypothetical protein